MAVSVSHKESMEFHKLTVKQGLNMTVRRYDKWLGATGIYNAVDGAGRKARIRIVETLDMVFRDLKLADAFLPLVNDPDSRTFSLLHTKMRGHYPGRPGFVDAPQFDEMDHVTVVFFVVVDKGVICAARSVVLS